MSIRPYADSDLQAIFDVYASAKLDEFKFEEQRFALLPLERDSERLRHFRACDVIVHDDGGVAGFAATSDMTIRALFVHRDAQGQGVGRKLLEAVLARSTGRISLNVAKSNIPAKRLYLQYGFRVTAEFETAYNGVKVLYETLLARDQ